MFEMRGVHRQNRAPLQNRGFTVNEQTLSRRLERVAAHVPQGARLADIGSDHGYLPVALMLRGVIEAGVAGEVAQTPFASAQRNVRRNGLEGRITVRLADGLAAVEADDRISVISICGMGGDTMCIVNEELLRENRFDYEIIVAEPGEAAYTAEQLYFGPVLLQEKSEAFRVKWRRMLKQKQQTLANFERARDAVPQVKIDDFNRQVGWITQVLA